VLRQKLSNDITVRYELLTAVLLMFIPSGICRCVQVGKWHAPPTQQ
jgi:hypothetical protein